MLKLVVYFPLFVAGWLMRERYNRVLAWAIFAVAIALRGGE